VPCEGWRRADYFDACDLPWVMPSPNMPTLDTALVYPGAVLFEGTQLSEGRGTTRPFEILGAPWLDATRLARTLNDLALDGVYFRPIGFQPTFHKFAEAPCFGVQVHVLERARFRPVLTATAIMGAMHQQQPGRFAWRLPPYEYEVEKRPIDILSGTTEFRLEIEEGYEAHDIAAGWEAGVAAFEPIRSRFLLY
jgi:uncharacterized protein YbbC (DUF1343 family)